MCAHDGLWLWIGSAFASSIDPSDQKRPASAVYTLLDSRLILCTCQDNKRPFAKRCTGATILSAFFMIWRDHLTRLDLPSVWSCNPTLGLNQFIKNFPLNGVLKWMGVLKCIPTYALLIDPDVGSVPRPSSAGPVNDMPTAPGPNYCTCHKRWRVTLRYHLHIKHLRYYSIYNI